MSRPKAYWLGLVVYLWFCLCPAAALLLLSPPWALCFGAFAANVWIRGLVELFMLTVTRNWLPRYGILHNLLSLALFAALFTAAAVRTPGAASPSPTFLPAALLAASVVASLLMETYHALAFARLVQNRTTGESGVWFADAEQPKFAAINRITRYNNLALSALVGSSLGAFALQAAAP